MPRFEDSIDVHVPVAQVYNQWTQFEEFPKFMEGIQSVQQLDDTHVQWAAEIRGQSRQWTTEITEQQPDKKIAWQTIDGEVKNDGVVKAQVHGDLERFKQLIENRDQETGAWRGEVRDGQSH